MSLTELGTEVGKVETVFVDVPYIDDPLSSFYQVTGGLSHCLLLESAEINSKNNLQSLMLIDAALKVECRGQTVDCIALTDNGSAIIQLLADHFKRTSHILHHQNNVLSITFQPTESNLTEEQRLKADSSFDVLRYLQNAITPIRQHPHSVFLAGVFAYDMIANFEDLPAVPEGENDCPDYLFYLAESLLLIDHQQQRCELLGSVFSGNNVANSYFSVHQRLEQLTAALSNSSPAPTIASNNNTPSAAGVQVSIDDTAFAQQVTNLKQNIRAGDVFQVVPSRNFSLPCHAPIKAYQALKSLNPSPYMFYIKTPSFVMFGASPESALKYQQQSNQVEVYPIAGTRPRGKFADGSLNPDLDSRIELQLREDSKEKSEHLMLVDLARNDIARVAIPGTRAVEDLLKVDRYSHVMHLVSRVVGQLRNDLDALHAYQACMNMGTLVGAPKVRAAQLIREIEQQRRGSYGGAVGYLNGQGDMDTCIVIRSAFVKDKVAHIQAGAGVVFDSDPAAEAQETRSKANAVISAILQSQQ